MEWLIFGDWNAHISSKSTSYVRGAGWTGHRNLARQGQENIGVYFTVELTNSSLETPGLEVVKLEYSLRLKIKRNHQIGCLRTCLRKQPIIVLSFESENLLKFYKLESGSRNRCLVTYQFGGAATQIDIILHGHNFRNHVTTKVMFSLCEK